jgi:nucleolar protein 4
LSSSFHFKAYSNLVILPNSPLSKDLTPADLERRTNSHNARRALLKSNPSLYISRTRLSVRQIPLFVTERVLKHLALHAVRAFESEVKEGSRNGLTADELTDPLPTAEEKGEPPAKRQKRFTGRSTAVKQSKIVRQQDRVDVVTGKGRSRGYGFIEMHKHSDALRVLRWANCNPNVEPLFEQWFKDELEGLLKIEKAKDLNERDDAKIKRIRDDIEKGPVKKGKASLIVEFSIENVQVVQRRNTKQVENAASKVRIVNMEGPLLLTLNDQPSKTRREAPVENNDGDVAPLMKKVPVEDEIDAKSGHSIGSIIGRKRKERRKKQT